MFNPKRQCIRGEIPAARESPDQLAEQHLSLVVPIARSFQRRLPASVDFDDLVGAGNLGLVEAAHRFDSTKGSSFGTFARHRIRGAIADSLRCFDPISRSLRSQQKVAERATANLSTTLGRRPTEAETARQLRFSLRHWRRLRRELYEAGCSVNGYSMNGAVASPDVDKLPGTWADPERLAEAAETRQILDQAIETLPPRHKQVLHLYDLEEWTMKQIGLRLGVDESRISQIRAAALARLHVQLASRFR